MISIFVLWENYVLKLDNRAAAFRNNLGLAQAADVSRQTIVAIEEGTYSPSMILALQLSLLLDVPVNNLFLLSEAAVAILHQHKQQLKMRL